MALGGKAAVAFFNGAGDDLGLDEQRGVAANALHPRPDAGDEHALEIERERQPRMRRLGGDLEIDKKQPLVDLQTLVGVAVLNLALGRPQDLVRALETDAVILAVVHGELQLRSRKLSAEREAVLRDPFEFVCFFVAHVNPLPSNLPSSQSGRRR